MGAIVLGVAVFLFFLSFLASWVSTATVQSLVQITRDLTFWVFLPFLLGFLVGLREGEIVES
jgi:hypothetical protein